MNVTMMRKAIKLFRREDLPRTTQRHLQRKWLRQMELLGNRHCLAIPSPRTTDADERILQRESYMRFLRADGNANPINRSTPERERTKWFSDRS